MHTHTDTCTHSAQSVGPEKRYIAYACGATCRVTHVYMNYAKGMQQMWGSQVDMLTCSDACTHSDQDVHAEKGYLAHANKITQGHTYFCRILQEGEHTFTVR